MHYVIFGLCKLSYSKFIIMSLTVIFYGNYSLVSWNACIAKYEFVVEYMAGCESVVSSNCNLVPNGLNLENP